MEEEKIIIYNEENSYDTVVVENTDEIIYDETIQIIEIDEPELFTVGTDEAFASSGGQNPQLNHALLHNRDLPDQHTIRSITGLREELDEIESLKTVESDKRGCANYYMWKDEQSTLPTQRVGYFVSIHTRDHKISICNAETEIFGVTVGSAGFVGWQEDNPRDEKTYALVANTGVVKVRCWSDVVAGDYVMSSNDGTAVKTKNGHGYYVISIDNADGTRYAIISLDSTMNQVYDLSKEVDAFNMRVDNVEIKTNAAINAATEALKNSLEPNINSALQNSQNALDNANSALDKVTDLESGLTSDMENVKIRVDLIQDSMVTEIQSVASVMVKDLVDDAIETNQDVEDLRQEVGDTKETLDEAIKDVRGLSDEFATISKYLSSDYYTVDTWSADLVEQKGKIFYVKDEGLYYYYDVEADEWFSTPEPSEAGLLEIITSMRQQTDKNQSMIENLTSYSGKDYITLAEWNGYQKVDVWNQNMADPYIIYYEEYTGQYWQCDINNLDTPWSTDVTPPRDDLEEKDTTKVYYAEDTKRYYCYYDGGWHSSDASTAKLVQSIVLTRQIADENSAAIEKYLSYEGSDGDSLAAIKYAVDNNAARIDSLTSYVENDYIELDELWDETVRTEDDRVNIYYAKDSDGIWKYWYWKEEDQEPGWVGSPNPSDAGLVASIVNVHQQASDNGASIAALQSWQGETNDAIASLKSSVGEDGASMESLVINISKYTVGEYSQAYGLTVAEAQELLRDGTVFVPSKNTSESYNKEDDTYINRSFSKGFYYVWNKNDGIWYDGGDVVFTTSYIRGSDTTKYIVIEEGYSGSDVESNTNFEVGALYEWNAEKEFWKKVATLESNTLNRAISHIRQTENLIESSVSDVKGNLVNVEAKVDNMKAQYITQTHFDNMFTTTEQKSTVDTATLSMLAATGVIATQGWSEEGKNANKVYYDVENKRYYYCAKNDNSSLEWNFAESITDPNVAIKIKSAGIITAINGDESGVTIKGDKISITAENINLEGVVTFEDLQNVATDEDGNPTTVINGSNITTGVIKSKDYEDGSDGFAGQGIKIDLNNNSIQSKNLKIDTDGNITINGVLTANDVGSTGLTQIDGSRITTGYISVDRIKANSITAEKLSVGSITADKIAVGDLNNYCQVNITSYDAFGFTMVNKKYTVPDAIDGSWLTPKEHITQYLLGNAVSFAYNKEGDNKFLFQGEYYSKENFEIYFCVHVTLENGNTYMFNQGKGTNDVYFTNKGKHSFSKTITVPDSYGGSRAVQFRPMIYCPKVSSESNWFAINNITFRRANAGDITAGKIQSVDGNTYFDLDNALISTTKDTYNTSLSSGKIEFKYGTISPYDCGSINSYLYAGNYMLAIRSPDRIDLCIGGSDDTAVGNGLSVDKANVIITKPAMFADNVIFQKPLTFNQITTESDLFSGCSHTRTGYGTVKTGVGVVSGNTTAALELNDSTEIVARLDVADDGGYAAAKLYLTGTKGTSSPLAIGMKSSEHGDYSSYMWLNGNQIHPTSMEEHKTDINVYSSSAIDLINSSVIYSFKYKSDGDNALTKYGLVIERECPKEVIDNSGDAISLYSMTSLAWKGIQEMSKRLKILEERMK